MKDNLIDLQCEKAKKFELTEDGKLRKLQPSKRKPLKSRICHGVDFGVRESREGDYTEAFKHFEPQIQTSLLGPQDIRCVLMDPPWDRERGGGQVKRGADRHYPLMSVPDIHRTIVDDCEHWTRVCDSAHLWMWVTNPVLMAGEAHELVHLLGFEPKSCFTWVKMTEEGVLQKGLGQYSMGSTEHLLLCAKGDFIKPSTRHPTAFFAPRTEHSVKPEVSYQLVESSSPGGYLEIFARRPRPGWIVWGNEVGEEEETTCTS